MDRFGGSQGASPAVVGPPRLPFADRRAAGRDLAGRLGRWADEGDLVVLGLPRGGVPVAGEVARMLDAPLDVFVVRKLGVPGHEELALGAVASGGVRVLNDEVVATFGVSDADLALLTARARREVAAREIAYREGAPALAPTGRAAVLVDDGLATGASMRAAIAALRTARPRLIVVAVPVAPSEVCRSLRGDADGVVCAATPDPFSAVGLWYRDFRPVTADEVREVLRQTRR